MTLNRYNYALSSYLNYKDPSGHGVWEWLKDIFGFGEDEEEESKPVKETESPTTSIPKTTTKSTESKKKMDEAEKNAKTETCSSLEVPISKELMKELHWEPMTDKELNQLIEVLEKYEINTVNRMAYFFAQTRQETLGGYWKVEQNLSDGSVSDEKYFNEKYGPNTNSGKNVGNTEEGDGYLYRGAGAIQLTGRYNYQKFADAMDDPKIMELGADYVAENYFWEAGGYFWDLKNINEEIDDGATSDDISRIVNKYDKDTFDAREEKYKEAYKTLNEWKSNLS